MSLMVKFKQEKTMGLKKEGLRTSVKRVIAKKENDMVKEGRKER